MRLRIARKMDRGFWKRRAIDDKDKRTWWAVYRDDQLERALRRLRKSWTSRRTKGYTSDGKLWWSLTDDWFRGNRVESRLIRQRTIRRLHKAAA